MYLLRLLIKNDILPYCIDPLTPTVDNSVNQAQLDMEKEQHEQAQLKLIEEKEKLKSDYEGQMSNLEQKFQDEQANRAKLEAEVDNIKKEYEDRLEKLRIEMSQQQENLKATEAVSTPQVNNQAIPEQSKNDVIQGMKKLIRSK